MAASLSPVPAASSDGVAVEFADIAGMRVSLHLPPGQFGQILRITGSGFRPYAAHCHDEVECNLVMRGTAAYLMHGRRYPLRPNALIWLFPAQEHVLIDPSPDLDLWVVAVHAPRLDTLLPGCLDRALLARDPPGHFLRPLAGVEAGRLARLIAEVDRDRPAANGFNAGLATVLLRAWRLFHIGDPEAGRALHPAVDIAAQLLARRDPPPSLAALAAAAGLSPARLSRTFSAQMGLGIAAYRNRCRLERAIERHGDGLGCTWLEAALWAGFGSYDQFHRTYHGLYGHGPRAGRGAQAGGLHPAIRD
jgi:AraC-like DNA-binding protein